MYVFTGASDGEAASLVRKCVWNLHGALRVQLRVVSLVKSISRSVSFLPQDSSSVIQFMARAKVKVDPALRVVEIANGNAEETLVSQLPWDSSPQRIGAWSWDLRGKKFSKPR